MEIMEYQFQGVKVKANPWKPKEQHWRKFTLRFHHTGESIYVPLNLKAHRFPYVIWVRRLDKGESEIPLDH